MILAIHWLKVHTPAAINCIDDAECMFHGMHA